MINKLAILLLAKLLKLQMDNKLVHMMAEKLLVNYWNHEVGSNDGEEVDNSID